MLGTTERFEWWKHRKTILSLLPSKAHFALPLHLQLKDLRTEDEIGKVFGANKTRSPRWRTTYPIWVSSVQLFFRPHYKRSLVLFCTWIFGTLHLPGWPESPLHLVPIMFSDGNFGFARIKGFLALVQVSHATPLSALGTVDVKVFRHEFINIFRFSERRTLHPNDINFIEQIDDDCIRYEEDNETVFLSRDAMDLMRKLIDPRKTVMGQKVMKLSSCSSPRSDRHSRVQLQRQRQW